MSEEMTEESMPLLREYLRELGWVRELMREDHVGGRVEERYYPPDAIYRQWAMNTTLPWPPRVQIINGRATIAKGSELFYEGYKAPDQNEAIAYLRSIL